MKSEQMIEALERAAALLDVQVRYEALGASGVQGGGGLCKVRGAWWVIIEKKATASERVAILADALCGFDSDNIDLPPKVREISSWRVGRPAIQLPARPSLPEDLFATC
jgi:hypothetical protein